MTGPITTTELWQLHELLGRALDDRSMSERRVTPTGNKRAGTDLLRALDAVRAELRERGVYDDDVRSLI